MIKDKAQLTKFKIEKKQNTWKIIGKNSKYYYVIFNLDEAAPKIKQRFYVYKDLLDENDWKKLIKGDFNKKKKLNLEYTRQKPKYGSFISNRVRKIN